MACDNPPINDTFYYLYGTPNESLWSPAKMRLLPESHEIDLQTVVHVTRGTAVHVVVKNNVVKTHDLEYANLLLDELAAGISFLQAKRGLELSWLDSSSYLHTKVWITGSISVQKEDDNRGWRIRFSLMERVDAFQG